jgi:hypothetical protein
VLFPADSVIFWLAGTNSGLTGSGPGITKGMGVAGGSFGIVGWTGTAIFATALLVTAEVEDGGYRRVHVKRKATSARTTIPLTTAKTIGHIFVLLFAAGSDGGGRDDLGTATTCPQNGHGRLVPAS